MAAAVEEVKYAQTPGVHDYVVINDDLEKAYAKFEAIALEQTVECDRLPKYIFEESGTAQANGHAKGHASEIASDKTVMIRSEAQGVWGWFAGWQIWGWLRRWF